MTNDPDRAPQEPQPGQPKQPRSKVAVATLATLTALALLVYAMLPCCAGAPEHLSEDARRGRRAYRVHCSACHDPGSPFLEGHGATPGPPIDGSSEELIRARVAKESYPPGYKPKRTTNQMYKLPRAVPEIPYLFAYLKEARKPEGK